MDARRKNTRTCQVGSKDVVCPVLTSAISCGVRVSQESAKALRPRVDGSQQRYRLPVSEKQPGLAAVMQIHPGGLGSDPYSATYWMCHLEQFH